MKKNNNRVLSTKGGYNSKLVFKNDWRSILCWYCL